MKRELAPGLWVLTQPLSFFGLQIGVTTTAVKRPDGSIWVHSPGPATEELADLGPVSDLVAPNSMHHMNLPRAVRRFPQARVLASPGVFSKQRGLELSDLTGHRFGDDLAALEIGGLSLREFVFLHLPSATLILTDLGFNLRSSPHLLTRVAMTLDGAYGRFACPRSHRLFIHDARAFRRSLEEILEWPFERIVVGHGEAVEHEARQLFREGFERRGWLRSRRPSRIPSRD